MLTRLVMDGIAHELNFWKGFVQTPRFLEGWVGDHKTPELKDQMYAWLRALPSPDSLKVLDVGSGAVSLLNGSFPKHNITTVDPLGSLYPFIFDYAAHGIAPPIACGGEDMEFENEFDIVHISNAIDHTQDPKVCFEKLVKAARPGGFVAIQGFENEAVSENWAGFHQWNFVMDQETGEIGYSGRDGINIKLEGEQVYKLYLPAPEIGRAWFISVWKKPLTDEDRQHARTRIQEMEAEIERLRLIAD